MSELSIQSIMKRDYFTALSVLTVSIFWLMCVVTLILSWKFNFSSLLGTVFLTLSLIVSSLGLPFIVKRKRRINFLVGNGIGVEAVFDGYWQFKDHVCICYHYHYKGKAFNGRFHMMSLQYGQKFQPGDRLNLLINPMKPSISIIHGEFD